MQKLLIVVDFQNDFVNGTLGFDGAEKLDARIASKIKEYQSANNPIWYTMDVHDSNYLKTQEGKNLPIEHCIENTDGCNIFGSVADLVRKQDLVFKKQEFCSAKLYDTLKELNKKAQLAGTIPFESIELVGLVTNICVVNNAVLCKLACSEVPIIIDASCVGSYDQDLHEKTLDVMNGFQCIITNRN